MSDLPGGVITTHCVSTVVRPGSKQNHDPLQFVKIQSTELSQKAVEQIRLAEGVKITKEKNKEVEEEWRNNFLNWKSKRRQSRLTGGEESDSGDNQQRKIKTFSEILNEKAKSGQRIGYNLHKYIGMQDEEEEENLVITNNNNNNNDKRGTDVTKGKSKSDASAQQQPCKQVKKSEKVKRTADQITSRLFPTTSANSYSPSSSQTSSCTTLSAAATPTVSIQNLKEVKNPQVNNSNNSLVHPHQQHHYHSRTSSEETRESSSSTWETSNFVCDKEVEKISERMNRGNVIPAEFGNGNGHETITSTSVHYNNSGLPGLPATSMNQHYHSSSHLSHPHLLQQQRSQYGYDQVKMNRHSVPNLNGPGRGYDQQQYSVSSEQISGLLINSMSSLDDFLTELEKNLNDFEHGHKTVLANISNTHSNSNVLEEEEETVAPKKSLVQCNLCDKAFPDGPSIRSHISWHGRKGRKSKSRGFRSNQT